MNIQKTSAGKFHINGTFSAQDLADVLIKDAPRYFVREDGEAVSSPAAAKEYVKAVLSHHESEVFGVIFMNNRHFVTSFEILFYGTIDGASVYPREAVKRALANNAAAVILTHNHPSGISEPSQADIQITSRLKEALALIDVRVLDHLIVGDDVTSLSDRGLI